MTRCTCQPTDELLLTLLEGRDRPLCDVHDADELNARAEAERRAAVDEINARHNRVRDQLTPEPDHDAPPDVRRLIVDTFTGAARADAATPLGGPGIDYALRAAFGPTTPIDPTELP